MSTQNLLISFAITALLSIGCSAGRDVGGTVYQSYSGGRGASQLVGSPAALGPPSARDRARLGTVERRPARSAAPAVIRSRSGGNGLADGIGRSTGALRAR